MDLLKYQCSNCKSYGVSMELTKTVCPHCGSALGFSKNYLSKDSYKVIHHKKVEGVSNEVN